VLEEGSHGEGRVNSRLAVGVELEISSDDYFGIFLPLGMIKRGSGRGLDGNQRILKLRSRLGKFGHFGLAQVAGAASHGQPQMT
jgi:hypothetical protein